MSNSEPGRILGPHQQQSGSGYRQKPGFLARILGRRGRYVPSSRGKLPSSLKILLYLDITVIQDMRTRFTAQALVNDRTVDKVRRSILGRSLLPADLTADGLVGLDEFTMKPAAKWTLGAELGAEFELKWNLGDTAKIDNTLTTLMKEMPVISVNDLTDLVNAQDPETPVESVIYPNMPVLVSGKLRQDDDVSLTALRLHGDTASITIALNRNHRLGQARRFLIERPLLVCGAVQDIEGAIKIKSGAVLLCSE